MVCKKGPCNGNIVNIADEEELTCFHLSTVFIEVDEMNNHVKFLNLAVIVMVLMCLILMVRLLVTTLLTDWR